MPQKRNPVPIEHLRHLSSQTFGRARAMLEVMHNTPFTDMNDSEGETQAMGYQAFDSAYRVLDLLAALVGQIRVDPGRVSNNIKLSCITITELADSLVRREGLSFREGHEIAAAVARAVVAAGGDLESDGYEPFRAAFETATGRSPEIDEAVFSELVSPEYFVAVRTRFGGPAPEPLAAALIGYREAAAAFAARHAGLLQRQRDAARTLEQRFTALKDDT
jgi:argininosuccinate lyase